MTKEEFISHYLTNHKLLKNNKLPYGISYLNLLAEIEEKAEKAWERIVLKHKNFDNE